MQVGYAVGWALALFFSWLIFAYLVVPKDYAWRLMFFVGITPAILVFFLRRFIECLCISVPKQPIAAGENPASVFEIFAAPLLRVTIFGVPLGAGSQGGWQAVMVLMPLNCKKKGMSVSGLSGSILVNGVNRRIFRLHGGCLLLRYGWSPQYLIFAISLMTIIVYMLVPFPEGARLLIGAPRGFFHRAYSVRKARF